MFTIKLCSYILIARLASALTPEELETKPPMTEPAIYEPLRVRLTQTMDTVMQVVIDNQVNSTFKIFKTGTILDDKNPVQRLSVQDIAGKAVPFQGISSPVYTANLSEFEFRTIRPKETIVLRINFAEIYDLSAGGLYDIFANGTLLTVNKVSNDIIGIITYRSNRVRSIVDGAKASLVHQYYRAQRLMIADNCNAQQIRVIKKSLDNCVAIARAGEWGAKTDPYAGYMNYFFHSNTSQMRRFVADVFQRLRHECSVPTDGLIMLSCGGKIRKDFGNKRIYTYEPNFWKKEARNKKCDYNDQAIDTARMLIRHEKIGATSHIECGRDLETGTLYPSTFRDLETPSARQNTDNFIFFAEVVGDRCFIWEGFFVDRGESYTNQKRENRVAQRTVDYYKEII
ncbi:hypothetical protein XA68_16073 [Ophiocordyceps unilateralis]|uniref:deuterolysin n=1 Tax=Ophiocordyceps unilateralis TaxID=268505 RepID=A0A2A9PLS3_OPHUN|nr:hypothetical protein XA68_16073 [Ophiocordyceps unilateralis]